VPLPLSVQRLRGVLLQVVDYKVEPMQALADATGTATLTTKFSVDPDQIWRCERLVVQSASGNKLGLQVTDGTSASGPINFGLRDYGQMPAGFSQVAEWPAMLTLLGGQQFTLIATGAAANDVVAASLQYTIVMKVPA
jgi:hypothetical protein